MAIDYSIFFDVRVTYLIALIALIAHKNLSGQNLEEIFSLLISHYLLVQLREMGKTRAATIITWDITSVAN